MGHGNSLLSDEEGVSNVVAVVLLIGLTLVGVVVILATGFVSINETSQQADLQLAEESMLQIDSALEQSSGGNTSLSFPDQLEGQVAVSNDATYTLTLNENSQCTTGERNLSTVAYDDNGQSVAYQGGGVWRMTESGATMVSPPDIAYDQGSLSFSFVKIDGQVTTTDELNIETNTTRQNIHQRNISLALYTDRTYSSSAPDGNLNFVCRPSEVENATLTIEDSQYAGAWARWADGNYDSDLVSVTDPGSVDSGDTVTVRYSLGDVSEAEFGVSDVRATRAGPDSDIQVTANVTNRGGLRRTTSVTMDYPGVSESTDVRVGGGDSKRVTFTIDDDEIVVGDEPITVSVDGGASETEYLDIDSADAVPEVTLDADSVPESVGARTRPNAEVTVTNNGGMTAFERLEIRQDGATIDTLDAVVGPGSSVDVPVGDRLPTDQAGQYTLEFTGDIAPSSEDETIDPFTVGTGGTLSLVSSSSTGSVDEDETVTIEATVTNEGDQERTGDIDLEIARDGTEVYAPSSRTVTLDGRIDGPETETETWSYTADDGVGTYNYTVSGPGIRATGQFTVGPPPSEEFIVTRSAVTESTVVEGNETTIDVEVTNTGSQPGTQTVQVRNERTDELLGEWSPSLNPGESDSDSWTLTAEEPTFELGDNEINITTANTSSQRNIDVREEIQTIADADGEITVNRESTVRITMEGSELEGSFDAENEYPTPTVMTLVIRNESGTFDRELWTDVDETDGDVNHPAAERAMQQDDYTNVYTETLQVEQDTTLALYADVYGCGSADLSFSSWDYDDTGINHPDRVEGDSTDGMVCEPWEVTEDPILEISNETNPNNVAIYGNNEFLPAFEQASPYQLGIDDMLGGRVEDDGRLSLRSDERVFLFELSDEGATPAEASGDGDPDYNDAVARFEVVSVDRTETTPAEFIITDYDAPAQVDEGDDTTLSVTVANIGGEERPADVTTNFEGATLVNTTSALGTGESETVTFDLDTGSLAPGSYEFVTNADGTSGDTRSRYVTVGEPARPNFIAGASTADDVVDTLDTPQADITVDNVGGDDDTQNVVLQIRNESDPSWRDWNSSTVSLTPGEDRDLQLGLPNATGNYDFRVQTDNVTTSSLPLTVGTTNVYPNEIFVRYDEFSPGSLVEETGSVDNMTVQLANDGTVGEEREVRFEITDNDENVVFSETGTETIGGNERLSETALRNVTYQPELGPGYYNYTITVYNDTQGSSRPERTVEGGIYVREIGDVATDPDNSPIEVDAGTISVG